MLKIAALPKIELRHLTIAAIASGIGAALGYALIPWYCAVAAAAGMLFLNKRNCIRFAVWFFIAIAAGIIHRNLDKLPERAMPQRACLLEAEMQCIDRRSSRLTALPTPSVLNCRITHNGKSFTAALILPEHFPRVMYGERFSFRGRFYPATPAGVRFDGSKLGAPFPPLYGGRPLIVVEKLTPLPAKFTCFGMFFECRDFLLRRLLAGVDDPAVRTMAAKTFFSASTGAPAAIMKDFVTSGTVHLFSVSGLHVSVLAGLLLLLLRAVPFVWRYRITAAVIPFYVLCTGASVPAIRAGAMLTIWCVLRSMLFYAPGWNSMLLVWCFFALFSPATLAELGPQYSFVITGALLLLIDKIKFHYQRERAILDLMPTRAKLTARKAVQIRRKYRLITFISIAVTAFAAGSGLSLLRQWLFLPGSIAANLLLPFFTPLLFAAMVFKMLCGALLPVFDAVGAWLLCAGFNTLSAVVAWSAQMFPAVPALPPPEWCVVIFYMLLFGALGSRSGRVSFICGISCAVLLLLVPVSFGVSDAGVIVVSRGANVPALLAYLPPGSSRACILDVPDNATAALAERLLRANGIHSARVGFSRGIRAHNYGLKPLVRNLDCTILPPSDKRKSSRAFDRMLENSSLKQEIAPPLPVFMPDGGTVVWLLPDGTKVTSAERDDGRAVSVAPRNAPAQQVILPWSSLPVVWECRF